MVLALCTHLRTQSDENRFHTTAMVQSKNATPQGAVVPLCIRYDFSKNSPSVMTQRLFNMFQRGLHLVVAGIAISAPAITKGSGAHALDAGGLHRQRRVQIDIILSDQCHIMPIVASSANCRDMTGVSIRGLAGLVKAWNSRHVFCLFCRCLINEL